MLDVPGDDETDGDVPSNFRKLTEAISQEMRREGKMLYCVLIIAQEKSIQSASFSHPNGCDGDVMLEVIAQTTAVRDKLVKKLVIGIAKTTTHPLSDEGRLGRA